MEARLTDAVPPPFGALQLRWHERAVETDYRRWRADRAVPFVRTSAYASAAAWAVFAGASVRIGPHFSRLVLPTTLLVMVPLIAGVLGSTYPWRLRRWTLQASAAANLIAGIATVAIIHRAGAGFDAHGYADAGTAAVVLLVYYGCTIMHLPPSIAAIAIAPYVIVQQVLVLQAFTDDPTRKIAFSSILLIAVTSGLLLSVVLDHVTRNTFRQSRVIAAQRQVIEQERERSDQLLLSILPAPIAEQLKVSPGTIAETHPEVTVVFADVVGFTALASRMSATGLVELLNTVFSRFDRLAAQHGVEKIKTIGDAYMAVAGLPHPRPDHVRAGADLALAMRDDVVRLGAESGHRLEFRIGMHTGPAVAGVIGTAKFAYDLWGETVNLASRMQSHGMPGRIQVTDEVVETLRPHGYRLAERGLVDIKGRGRVRTWFLEAGPDETLMTADDSWQQITPGP